MFDTAKALPQNNLAIGMSCFTRGLGLLTKPDIRPYVLMPLLINIVVFSALVWLGISQFTMLLNWLLPEDGWFSFLRTILWPIFALSVTLIVFYTFTTIANLIAAPFNGLLAERVERHLNGTISDDESSSWKQALKDIAPSIFSELRKILYFSIRAVPLLILFIIPVVNLAAPFLWIIFSAWFLALEYADYPMANHKVRFKQQHRLLKQNRWSALGFGATTTLVMMVPILNFFAMPAAVAGATLLWHERLRSSAEITD